MSTNQRTVTSPRDLLKSIDEIESQREALLKEWLSMSTNQRTVTSPQDLLKSIDKIESQREALLKELAAVDKIRENLECDLRERLMAAEAGLPAVILSGDDAYLIEEGEVGDDWAPSLVISRVEAYRATPKEFLPLEDTGLERLSPADSRSSVSGHPYSSRQPIPFG